MPSAFRVRLIEFMLRLLMPHTPIIAPKRERNLTCAEESVREQHACGD
ncbi:MAG: hypothetical protein NZ556_02375 [Fimbriimonadales bacterium]|nr:hypothetical protein [Fimbriimonadales bacterium]